MRQCAQPMVARMLALSAICLGFAAFRAEPVKADVIVSYDLGFFTSSRSRPTIFHNDVTASEYTAHGNTALSTSNTHFIRVDQADHAAKLATIEAAIDNDMYGQFTVTVAQGMQLNLLSLGFDMENTRGVDGESFTVHLRSSLDDFASDIATVVQMGDSNVATVQTTESVDLSQEAFQNLTGSVTFRFYMVTDIADHDGSQYIRILPNIELDASVVPVPEPGTSLLAGLGGVMAMYRHRRCGLLR